MKIEPIKTKLLDPGKKNDLFAFLADSINQLEDGSIVAVTSKIISICQNRIVKIDQAEKEELIKKEADYYLMPQAGKSESIITIKDHILQIAGGIDESNANNHYILPPQDLSKITNQIRKFLKDRFKLKNLGIIVTDSRSTPLRRGVVGVGLSYSGFRPVDSYIGQNDLFGRKLKVSETNTLDCLASVAVLVMGEGREQTPLAVLTELDLIKFNDRDPTEKELKSLKHSFDLDLYYDLIVRMVNR
jgi:dihydrofolate synthase / folylpolyglutamate synthase